MPYKDPEKRKEALRRWYSNNRASQIERVKRQGHKIRDEVRNYKASNSCVDCGQQYQYFVMDFDHVRGEKIANVADIINRSCSRKAVWEEIAKCDLVCANCHRCRTHSRKKSSEADALFKE